MGIDLKSGRRQRPARRGEKEGERREFAGAAQKYKCRRGRGASLAAATTRYIAFAPLRGRRRAVGSQLGRQVTPSTEPDTGSPIFPIFSV